MKYLKILLMLVLFHSSTLYSQDKGIYTDQVTIQAGQNAQLSLPVITSLPKQVKTASVTIRSDFGGDYVFGEAGREQDFRLEIGFTLKGYEDAVEVFARQYSFTIDNDQPEGYVYKDLRDLIVSPGTETSTGMSINRLELTEVTVTDVRTGGSYQPAVDDLRLHLHYDIHYGIDVSMHGDDIQITGVVESSNKVRDLSWSAMYPYPNYQIQVLKLYNIDPELTGSEDTIRAVIDWSKALTIETESSDRNIRIKVLEGHGYYVWRIRPIGTFYEGGVANSANWGAWDSAEPADGDTVFLTTTGSWKYLYHIDWESGMNYIYSRYFTEHYREKESISYANGLLQEKQTQVYIPSDDNIMISQTVYDYEGRPALRTLPTPAFGRLGYRNDFLIAEDNTLYSEKHFDNDTTLYDPARISESISRGPMSYYNGENNIPSAEGYPYSRVIFYNDGSGRIKEQSGVGKTHMVGSRQQGRGRTVRTLYGTSSEDELLALFGSEAPNHETVQKVITIDQNDVASISYIGKDGKVIATALSFFDDTDTTLLPLSDSAKMQVRDRVTGGMRTNDGYVSSKRLVFTEPTAFVPEYMIECNVFELPCADINLDCGYDVLVNIHNLGNPDSSILLSSSMNGLECEDITVCGVTKQYKVVGSSAWGVAMPLILQPGTYVVEKRLVPKREVSVTLEEQLERIRDQVTPIKDWIVNSLKDVNCPDELEVFYRNLITLSGLFREHTLQQQNSLTCSGCDGEISFPDSFWSLYTNPELTDLFDIEVWGKNGPILSVPFEDNPIEVVFSTPCCENIHIDVRYTPLFKCPLPQSIGFDDVTRNPDGDPAKPDVNYHYLTQPDKTEFFPDFEGYAISMLRECPAFMADQCANLSGEACDALKTEEARKILYGHMPGWEEGMLNTMVYHMLTDVYSCDGTGENEEVESPAGPKMVVNECSVEDTSYVPGTRYRCFDLATCWTNLVMLLTQSYCEDPANLLADMQGGGNISNGFDEQNKDDESVHDDHFDEGLKDAKIPGLLKWFVKQKLSSKMRKMQDINGGGEALPEKDMPKFTFHLVDMFLECTGYQFAGVLDPAPENECGSNGVINTDTYKVSSDFDGNTANGEYNSCPYKAAGWVNTPVELDENFVPVQNSRTIKDLFPNIQHPIYAFKYFEYAEGTYPTLEGITCYRDPNDCYDAQGQKIPCCGDPSDPFCIKEYGHPMADQSDANGDYKLLVKNFCSMGKIICPYLKEDWTCSQSTYFYNMLKAYREFPTPPEPDDNITCNWMTMTRSEWYELPSGYEEEISLDYISREQYINLTGSTPENDEVEPVALPGLAVVNGQTDYLSEQNKTTISYVEYMATLQKRKCLNRCAERREEFRKKVIEMFSDRCYVFSGCKRSAEDNIVTMQDVERIVDEIIDQCKRQCPLTTFTCETGLCRLINTPRWPGADPNYVYIGPNQIENDLQLGVGGHPDEPNDCPAGVGTMTACCTNLTGNPPVTVDGVECNAAYQLSFYEQTNWLQAQEWDLRLDIESRCNQFGEYVDSDDDGAMDEYDLYYYTVNEEGMRVLVAQNANDLNCSPRPPANTFVEKSAYEVRSNVPVGTELPGQTVVSPKIGIEVH